MLGRMLLWFMFLAAAASWAIGLCWSGSTPEPLASPPAKSAAIVLLAGHYEERSPVAAALYHAGYAPRIILTDDGVRRGWSQQHKRNLYAIERSEIALVQRGVPQRAIVRLPFRKSGTIHDALAVKNYLVREGLGSIILVTSDYHIHRAFWVFRRVLRKHPVAISTGVSHSVAPNRSVLHLPLESLKMLYYWARYAVLTDPAELK